ncbi:uncharacterized protein LOC123203180 [Mangifera indica]|uniref:uncharacterized protein LOC123203180 n=1 Tax=Mangifera indica TaxID=29780 RepID=UPI001CFC354C|nr:uncharacterized protein LOC123203180 [Mangifera indica]
MWSFLSVMKIAEDDNDSTSTYFKVKASKSIQQFEWEKSLFVIFLANITTSRRIWKSLRMSGNLKIINKVLCRNSVLEESCQVCSELNRGILYEKFGSGLSSTLNDSQLNAVLACLDGVRCDHKSSVQLIWGPLGTGKTKVVSMLQDPSRPANPITPENTVIGLERRNASCILFEKLFYTIT